MKGLLYAARPILQDMLSTILFAALFAITDNLVVSTLVAIALGVAQVAWDLAKKKPVPAMQWASLGLVAVLGGAALVTGDARFVMIKPTVIYVTIGAAMLQPDWMERYIPPKGRPYMPRAWIVAWGYVWSALMFATAAANLFIALRLGHQAWLAFIGVFPLASKLGLFAIQYVVLHAATMRRARAVEAAAPVEAAA